MGKKWFYLFLCICCRLAAHDFPYEPPAKFTLNPKYIAIEHPVTTSNITAQLLFNQGLTLVYAFNHDAAYWSFYLASKADPSLAMAYWGMALSIGSNINMTIGVEQAKRAYELVQKAVSLSQNASQPDKDYIHALAKRYDQNPNAALPPLAKAYSDAMRQLSQKYPEDLDAAVLYAESLLTLHPWDQWTVDGQPKEGALEAIAVLESVLKRDSEHLGANHYYIHAVEASSHPELALAAADRLAKLLPASGHILHMPSHIYILLGDFHKAALANEAAVAADREYTREYGLAGIYPIHYMSHNLYFLSRAYSLEGRFVDAKHAADELYALYFPHFSSMTELEYYLPPPMLVLLRFHKWEELLQMPAPAAELGATVVLWHFARAIAFANLGQLEKAKAEQAEFNQLKQKVKESYPLGYNNAQAIFAIADSYMAAKIAEKQGNVQQAEQDYLQAISLQDKLHYNEPPDWFFPLRESLGGFLMRNKRYPEAEAVFRQDLIVHPKNGRALFGLRESLAVQNKWHDYYWVDQQFQKAWRYSDTELSIETL